MSKVIFHFSGFTNKDGAELEEKIQSDINLELKLYKPFLNNSWTIHVILTEKKGSGTSINTDYNPSIIEIPFEDIQRIENTIFSVIGRYVKQFSR